MDKLENIDVVGIDIDCVLTELEPTMMYMGKYFDKPVAGFDEITDYNLSDAYGITEEESLKFWKDEEYFLCRDSIPSEQRIKSIYENFVGDETAIVVITSRDEKYSEVTASWLEDNDIKYDLLVMTSGASKKPFIEHFKMDYMIDDKPDLFYEMQDSDTKMVCVDYEYNKYVPSQLRMNREGDIVSGEIIN